MQISNEMGKENDIEEVRPCVQMQVRNNEDSHYRLSKHRDKQHKQTNKHKQTQTNLIPHFPHDGVALEMTDRSDSKVDKALDACCSVRRQAAVI